MDLRLLLRTAKRFGTAEALEVVQLTLDKMAAGGNLRSPRRRFPTVIRPTPAGSCRTSRKCCMTTRFWQTAYIEDFSGDQHEPRLPKSSAETLDYVLREMTERSGRLLQHAGRRQRRRRGKILRLERRRGRCDPRPRENEDLVLLLRRHATRKLGRSQHPQPRKDAYSSGEDAWGFPRAT